MTNPSSPSSSSSNSARQRRRHNQEANDEVGHGIPFPEPPEEDDDEGELSPPRLEWDFRLAATVPSAALPGASDAIGSVDFDPAGRLLATGGIARKVRIYTVADFLHPPSSASSSSCSPAACICVPAKLSSVRWRPEGGAIGCGDYDGVVTEYDAERGVAAWERDEHSGRRVWALDYAPSSSSSSLAASGSDDRTAHVWDPRAPTGTSTWATARAGGAVLCVEFDPSGGPQLAVGSADRRAAVYDVRALGRGAVASMDGHARAVTYVRWAPARRVVTSAADGTHRLWEWPAASEIIGPAREVRSYSGHVSARSFVGMGLWRGAGLVASGSESNHVFVYDLRWAKPVWVHPFGVGDGDAGGFVSAVAWRQGDADGGGGALVAGRSDGVLKMFTCQPRTQNQQVGDQ